MDAANIPGFGPPYAGQPGGFGVDTNPAFVKPSPLTLLASIAAVILLGVISGCGSDSSGETTDSANANANGATSVSVPSVTSPIPTTTTMTTAEGGKAKTTETTTTAPTGGGSGACSVPAAFEDFKFSGLDCDAALTVAKAWDANGKTCNTVDNPESPIGPQRTCTVNGYSCTAKRDIHSDARFVTCTQGGRSVRFTWLPA